MSCIGDNPRYMNNIKSVVDGKCDDVIKCEYRSKGFQTTYPLCLSDEDCVYQEISNVKIGGITSLICKNNGYRTVIRDDEKKG